MDDTLARAPASASERDLHDAPELTCLLTGELLTRRDLEQDARALARALIRLGLKRGDDVSFRNDAGMGVYPLAMACCQLGLNLVSPDRAVPLTRARTKFGRHGILVLSDKALGTGALAEEAFSLDDLRLMGRARRVDDPEVCGEQEAAARPMASPPGHPGLLLRIRTLRTPLHFRPLGSDASVNPHDDASGPRGEIVLEPSGGVEHRTGDIGWLTAAGSLVIAGKLSDVAIRNGRAVLLSQLDVVLRQHPAVRSSVTFRERGLSPAERVVTVCETEVGAAELGAWIGDRVDSSWVPDTITSLPNLPQVPGAGSLVPTLRAMVGGQASVGVVTALNARRFRRSPAYDEAGLRDAVQAALMARRPLDFLMFWGCGPRSIAAPPDHMAIEALGELLAAVAGAAPMTARADIIFTDGHATNNGYSRAHYRSYFSSVERAAAELNVAFHLESEVWRQTGLSKESVSAFEQTPGFAQKWQTFPLRDRFVRQASRHSSMSDPVAAARHYYATCLLERDALKAHFAGSVFLTYNGPEFNECFPDLPTLYIYPGPRGRTDKPWFVHDGEDSQGLRAGLAVAAE